MDTDKIVFKHGISLLGDELETVCDALASCLDSMQRQFPNGLPVQQGTLCEEQDWDNATRKASEALAMLKELSP